MTRTPSLIALAAAVLLAIPLSARAQESEDANVATPFNGKNLEGWTFKEPKDRSHWTVGFPKMSEENARELTVADTGEGAPALVNSESRGVDAYTTEKYGDCTISLDFMVPQGSNSGIYVMGEYEIQILDSYGRERLRPGDLGGLYNAAAPKTNASKEPGTWQTFVIEFQAPRFENGEKTANAVFKKVTLNGEVIHENVEMKGPTPTGVSGKEAETGPLMFQGDHGPVAYRNIKITPTGGAE
ncbi:MAG: DUF1080 domain-containing protein [Pirellulales bacterium]